MVPAFKAADIGFDRSLIGAYGHDDRVCGFACLAALLALFLAIQLPKLDSVPWDQYESWRQSDTYSIAVNYVQYGMDLLHPQLNYVGVSENYAQLELQIVPFTHIQEEIRRLCPEELFTLIMRRFMMRIAAAVAKSADCGALITGESVGQVASQTIPAIACTDAVADLPVFRPLVGMDKEEIIAIARRIGTFEISIQPYEDCCTVFTPRHPRTRPKLAMVEAAEAALDGENLIREALEGIRRRTI